MIIKKSNYNEKDNGKWKKINACQYYKKRYSLYILKRSQRFYLITKRDLNANVKPRKNKNKINLKLNY
jgi:hypothetical protein